MVSAVQVGALLLLYMVAPIPIGAHAGPPPATGATVAASLTSNFSMHCPGKSTIPSLDWAIDTCHAKGGWLATPQNYADDTTIQALVTTVLGGLTNDYYVLLGGSDAWMESRWIWVDGPEKGRMFWTGTLPYPSETGVPIAGRYVPPPDRFWPEVTSSGSSGDLMVWFYPSAIAWGDVPNFNSITCYACQYQTCATPRTLPLSLASGGPTAPASASPDGVE